MNMFVLSIMNLRREVPNYPSKLRSPFVVAFTHDTGILSGADVMGITRDQCLDAIYNIDSRTQALIEFPFLRTKLCDRCVSTDDLESLFGQITLACKWKPMWVVATKCLQYMQELNRIKRDPDSKVHLQSSKRRSYPHYKAMRLHSAAWHANTHENIRGAPFVGLLRQTNKEAIRATRNKARVRTYHGQGSTWGRYAPIAQHGSLSV